MSWLDKIQERLVITTGDRTRYYPNWLNAVKTKEWNVARFEFIDVRGTLVKRGTNKGRTFNIEIYFQGEDHLDIAAQFEDSADDPRPWKIEHPFYGSLLCQPISLQFDNTVYNVSKITGTLVETIDESNPQIKKDPIDEIYQKVTNLQSVTEQYFSVNMPKLTSIDISHLTDNIESVNSKVRTKIKLTVDLQNYFNLFNDANAKILDITSEPLEAIRAVQAMLNAPALFTDNVQSRLNMLTDQFDLLVDTVRTILTVGDKLIFENNIVNSMATIAQAVVTEIDYENRKQVVGVVDVIVGKYDEMIELLDSLQTDNGGDPDSYIPDAASMQAIGSLVNTTVSQLFNIALNQKQERVVVLMEDTNVVLLTHKYYGLDAADENIGKMIRDNGIGLNELLQIKKNRTIVYYQ